MPWLSNLNTEQLTLELRTKLLAALSKTKAVSSTKQRLVDSLINDYVQPLLLNINDSEEREQCGLSLSALLYEQLSKKDTLGQLQMSLLENATPEKVKFSFNKEKVIDFCHQAGIDYEPERGGEISIEELALKGFLELEQLGNLEQFRIETSNLIEKFIRSVPKSQIVILIGNSPVYLYSLLTEQGYTVLLLPLSGIKQSISPSNEEGWDDLFYYLDQVIRAQPASTHELFQMGSFCLVDYAATGAGLLAVHRLLKHYFTYSNRDGAGINLNTVVIPSARDDSYQHITQLLSPLSPIMLFTPQYDEENITTQILDSKFLSKQGLRLCKQVTLENIINGSIKNISIDINGFIALQLVMKVIMQRTTFEEVLRQRDSVYQSCSQILQALQALDFRKENVKCFRRSGQYCCIFFEHINEPDSKRENRNDEVLTSIRTSRRA